MGGVTYAGQAHLKKLPIPELDDSLQRYLAALQPLQNAHEREETLRVSKLFLHKEGPKLQAALKKFAENEASYIEQFWYDSYLNYDNPVVLNLNPFFLLEDDPTPARNNQVDRAASLTISTLSFVRALRREELEPDKSRDKTLCMHQYSQIFGTARIPSVNGCKIVTDKNSKHIIVLCRSQFYWFDVLNENADILMTEKNLAQNFRAIIEDADTTPITEAAKSAIGVLSTENRLNWSQLRDTLLRDDGPTGNKECLSIVDSALFVVCLDDAIPESPSEVCMNMLCGTNVVERGVQVGTCTNRWYDKLQIIVCCNGSAGMNFEHTGTDGHTILRLASDVYTDTILRFAKTIHGSAPSIWPSSSPDPRELKGMADTTPRKLEWNLVPEIRLGIRFAETRLADLIQQNEFAVMEFMSYGKTFITSKGFSPDAFLQMAFQAAYYSLYGKLECTYEPAMTKIFFHGRTEAIRSVSSESLEFVRKFIGNASAQEKIEALRKACETHVKITKACAAGMGQDRHLYSLYCIWRMGLETNGVHDEEDRLPELFADAGWETLNKTILSTSNCGNPALRQFGFGPTSEEGFGVGYIIKQDSLSVCASSKHRQTKRFLDTLQAYLLDVRSLLRQLAATDDADAPLPTPITERRGKVLTNVVTSGTTSEDEENLDEAMGGYGYFDSSTMEALLRAEETKVDSTSAMQQARRDSSIAQRRAAIGRKLRLAEY